MLSGAGVVLPRRRRDSTSSPSVSLSVLIYKLSSYLCICFSPCPLFLFVGKKPWQLHRRRQVNRALEPNLTNSLFIWLLLSTACHCGISYPTVAQCILDPKSTTSLVVIAPTSALPTVVSSHVTIFVIAHPLKRCGFFGSVCSFTGVSLSVLVGHSLPKNTQMFHFSTWPDLVTNYSLRLAPTLASCLADLPVISHTPDIEAVPYREGFNEVKLHQLNVLLVTAVFSVQEWGFARFARYNIIAASPSHYAVSSIDGSSQSRHCDSPIHLSVAGTTVQEYGFARSDRYHVIIASPSRYAVSSVDGSSQSQLCDPQTGATIFNRGSRMSCSSHTPTHRVFTGVFRPLFIGARILPSAEASKTSFWLPNMTPLQALSRVRLVSTSSPLYMARPSSLQATTTAPQAVVTTFTFRLERFSTFSSELLESSPRLPQVPTLFYASFKWIFFFWVCSPIPMASDSPSPLQGVSMEDQPTPLPPTIQASLETWFNGTQNPWIGFFKVDFDVCAFLRTQALGLQVKFLFGSLLSLATSIFRLVLVIFVYQLTVEDRFRCNRLSPLGF